GPAITWPGAPDGTGRRDGKPGGAKRGAFAAEASAPGADRDALAAVADGAGTEPNDSGNGPGPNGPAECNGRAAPGGAVLTAASSLGPVPRQHQAGLLTQRVEPLPRAVGPFCVRLVGEQLAVLGERRGKHGIALKARPQAKPGPQRGHLEVGVDLQVRRQPDV